MPVARASPRSLSSRPVALCARATIGACIFTHLTYGQFPPPQSFPTRRHSTRLKGTKWPSKIGPRLKSRKCRKFPHMKRSPGTARGPSLVTGPPRCSTTRGASLTPGPLTSVTSPGLAHACVHLSMQISLRARGEGLARWVRLPGFRFSFLETSGSAGSPRRARGSAGAGPRACVRPQRPSSWGAPGAGRRPARAPERRPGGVGGGRAARPWGAEGPSRSGGAPGGGALTENPRQRSAFLTPCEGLSFSRECQCEMMSFFFPQT